ncbi:MAG TPA: hypothetical protein DCP63_02840 [Bacteroidetes bacterium]|nr:hypothetical protein [Bacteroidota bacterium]
MFQHHILRLSLGRIGESIVSLFLLRIHFIPGHRANDDVRTWSVSNTHQSRMLGEFAQVDSSVVR